MQILAGMIVLCESVSVCMCVSVCVDACTHVCMRTHVCLCVGDVWLSECECGRVLCKSGWRIN